MFLPTPYAIKRLLRICDSRWTRKRNTVVFPWTPLPILFDLLVERYFPGTAGN